MIIRYTYRWFLFACISWMLVMPLMARDWLPSLSPVVNEVSSSEELDFSFYGLQLRAAKINPIKVKSVRDHDVFKAWNDYKKRDVSGVLASLRAHSVELGLNDWFVFQLVRNYADELLNAGTPMDRVVLEHYLLVSMGYDVRLARTERQLILLIPFEEEVYERGYIKIGGKDYYLFFDDMEADLNEVSVVYPCDPSKKDLGKGQSFSLLFKDKALNVSTGEDRQCDFDDGQIHVACSVNPSVMKMLHNYPLMDLRYYAASVVLPQFHEAILEQLVPQLEGMSQCDAADALLHFVQYVFDYEEDDAQYGQEKVNFIEENFYYDKNDCEDRSVLYAFLVKTLLGLDVQFVHYPGHDCTAVRFTDCFTRGNGYYYGDDYYLICDPSYIGAPIGRCMPKYRHTQPMVKTMTAVTVSGAGNSPLEPRLDDHFVLPGFTLDTTPLQPSVHNR